MSAQASTSQAIIGSEASIIPLRILAKLSWSDVEQRLQQALDDPDSLGKTSFGSKDVKTALDALGRQSRDLARLATLRLHRPNGTGLSLEPPQSDEPGSGDAPPKPKLCGPRNPRSNAAVVDNATARLLQVQDAVELCCLPLGIHFQLTAPCDHQDRRPRQQQARCAMRPQDGITASFRVVTDVDIYGRVTTSQPRPMTSVQWASSLWDFVEAAPPAGSACVAVEIVIEGTVPTPNLERPFVAKFFEADVLKAKRQSAKRKRSAGKDVEVGSAASGASPSVPSSPARPLMTTSSSSSLPNVVARATDFRPQLKQECGGRLLCAFSEQGDDAAIDGAHILPSALQQDLVDPAMLSLFPLEADTPLPPCTPIFWRRHTWEAGQKGKVGNALALDASIHRLYDRDGSFLVLHGAVLVLGFPLGAAARLCREPRCPSLTIAENDDALKQLQAQYQPHWALRRSLPEEKWAALHVRSLVTFYRTYMASIESCIQVFETLISALTVCRALAQSAGGPGAAASSSPPPSAGPSSDAGPGQQQGPYGGARQYQAPPGAAAPGDPASSSSSSPSSQQRGGGHRDALAFSDSSHQGQGREVKGTSTPETSASKRPMSDWWSKDEAKWTGQPSAVTGGAAWSDEDDMLRLEPDDGAESDDGDGDSLSSERRADEAFRQQRHHDYNFILRLLALH